MSDVAIRVENLGKQYRIGAQQARYKTIRETITDGAKAPFRKAGRMLRGHASAAAGLDEMIWALKDVSFEVKRGEVVGVIGRNGAGKTTLLKILSRIAEPNGGEAWIHGRVGSLLEVGTGFHPELTGRENIYLNGAILGMKRVEIDRKFDEIIDFSEVEQFIDTPVKHFSSGMHVRLAFSVAAHLEPEILLVDEVLAVGDIAFQKKCLGKMEDVAGEGRTVVFVSHNLQAVRNLCGRTLLLNGGRKIVDGPTDDTIATYYDLLRELEVNATTARDDKAFRRGSGAVRFEGIQIEDANGVQKYEFAKGETIRFRLSYRVLKPVDHLLVGVGLRSGKSGEFVLMETHSVVDEMLQAGDGGVAVVTFHDMKLRSGGYPLYFWLGNRMRMPFDVVDGLTTPLLLTDVAITKGGDYRPVVTAGFIDVDSTISVVQQDHGSRHEVRKSQKQGTGK